MYYRVMSILFALGLSLALTGPALPGVSLAAAGTTIPGGDVSGLWTAAGSPYLIEGNITVPSGQTLAIEAGVQVIFQSWYQFTINGTLLADGSASAPILFTSTDSSPGWLGIRFIGASDGSRLAYAIVERGRASGATPLNSGGGIYIENSSPTLSYSIIHDNFATKYGGGIYLTGSDARLIGNTIANNQAGQGASASGGGIYVTNSNPELTGNIIRGNWVYVSGSYSTPYGSGGGIYASRSNPTLRYNLIDGNYVDGHLNSFARGGALFLSSSNADLIDNTITGNTVGQGSGGYYDVDEGGGIYAYQSELTLVNTILWNDTPQEIFVSGSGVPSTITAAYSDVHGGQAGITTNGNATVNPLSGNIDADPLFTDPTNGNYQLQAGSPAIDAGTAFFEWQGRVLVDLAPGDYLGAAPDMGAFEAESSAPVNRPPLAVASADPGQGDAPLTVQFSADGSYDPDGAIVSYAWDLGDGNTSSEANPLYTYGHAGTYNATLTVTDDGGATGGDAVAISVVQAGQDELHVEDQTVSRESRRRFSRGLDVVLVTNQNSLPVSGAVVTATYSGPNQGQVSGTTGSDGAVVLQTERVRDPQGVWCFEVSGVARDGNVYNPAANVVTVQCETQ